MFVYAVVLFFALFIATFAILHLASGFLLARWRRRVARHLRPFEGKAWVVDGDTIRVKGIRVRLFGMDAPEMSQTGGDRAKSRLIWLAGGRVVRIEPMDLDCYGRTVARVWLGEIDLSEKMVRDGFAIATSKWNKDYDSAELDARRRRRGLWTNRPDAGIDDPAAHRWKTRERPLPPSPRGVVIPLPTRREGP